MNKFVLDSSAVLASINMETGHENVDSLLTSSAISAVNVAEVLSKLAERGIDLSQAYSTFLLLGIEVIEFDIVQAEKTAELQNSTKKVGLSLGDRACLALAIIQKATVLTADKAWSKLHLCPVKLIR